MDQILAALRSAGEETRLRILMLLEESELTVSEIVRVLGQSQPRVSRHLKLLVEGGLLEKCREGTWMFYRLAQNSAGISLVDAIKGALDDEDALLARDRSLLEQIRSERKAAAQAYFKENAKSWNALKALHVAEEQVEEATLALAAPQTGDRLLDVGTGTGRMLELFSPKVNSALGVDISPEMLSIARSTLDELGYTNAQARLGDMYSLPVAAESQDIVTIHMVLHYADDPGRVVAEAARVLSPKGRLVIVDLAPHEEESLREQNAHRRLGFSDEAIKQFAESAGLQHVGTEQLKGTPLDITLWRFDKPE